MIRKAFFIFLFFSYSIVSAQESSNFTQFYMNPYRINPSYAGIEARGAMFLTYRKQWVGIEGAPTIMNFSFHNASKANANFGINVNNDAIGIVNSTSFSFTLGYTLPVSKNKYVRFGISAGAAMNTFDVDKLGNAYLSDPDLERLLSNNFNMIGDVGLSYHNKFFAIGVAAPNVFSSSYDSLSSFAVGNISAADKLIFHSNYRYYFGYEDQFAIEPHVIYRLRNKLPSQYEAALIFHMNHAFWIGGSYKQNFGLSGVGGIKINALFALGYSYSIANSELNSPSHEVQINMLFGKKKRLKHVYSFTDSKKPIVRKTRRQLLAEQHKAERERIEAEKVAAAKAAIAQAEEEKQKRLAEEQAEVARIAQEQKEAEVRQQQTEAQKQQQEEVARIAQEQKEAEVRQQQTEAQKQQQEEVARIAQEQKEAEVRQQQTEAQRQQQAEVARIAQEQKEADIRQQKENERQLQEAETSRVAKQQETKLPTQMHETKIDDKGNVESAFTTNEKIAVKQGGHFLELTSGEYVVIGAFSEFEHAELYSDRLFEKGYKTRFGYISQTKLWYVYLHESQDIEVARRERDKYRKLNLFKSVWVLTVEQ
ncbi:MAG: PorP/SprF family type IX secretion system membrane protein [Cyclobacteriaceae bacterium]|nr:PorP/SprF family type IX secretion system membrane protein [Cyclobacteriaceae bacterium]